MSKLEFIDRDDKEKHLKRLSKQNKINDLMDNLRWLGDTYLKLYKEISIEGIEGENETEEMYLNELFDYMEEYKNNLKKELKNIYNGLVLFREYCNYSLLSISDSIVRLISSIESLDIL